MTFYAVIIGVLSLFIELVILFALYSAYRVIRNMKDDLEYATTRIFLSPDSVKSLKFLMASLIVYGLLNPALFILIEGSMLPVLLRLNLLGLCIGWTYFLKKMANITTKSNKD